MVDLSEVQEGEEQLILTDDDMYEDQEDIKLIQNYNSDDEDEFYNEEESILDRLSALVDIIPPTVRARACNTISMTLRIGSTASGIVGSGLWCLATGALLVFLPTALELERDSMAIQQDFQMRGAQADTA